MSEENVEAFRRANEAFRRGDLDAWLEEFFDPEIEWHTALPGLLTQGGTVYRGHEGVREMFRELADTLDEIWPEYSEVQDVGDRVVGIGRIHTRGKASGAQTDVPFALVGDYRNGKTVRVRTYLDPSEALTAAGISE